MVRRAGVQKITPEQEAVFLDLVRVGMYPSEAAKMIGVTSQAISMRKKRNPAFRTAVERAEANCELGSVAVIVKSMDPRVRMMFLERRFPERWARPEIRAELNVTTVSAEAIVDGISKALKIAARLHAPLDEPDVDADEPDPLGDGDDNPAAPAVTRE